MEQRVRQLEETVAFLERNLEDLDALRAEVERLVLRIDRLERELAIPERGARTSPGESPLDL